MAILHHTAKGLSDDRNTPAVRLEPLFLLFQISVQELGELKAALKQQMAQIEKVSAQIGGDQTTAALLTRE